MPTSASPRMNHVLARRHPMRTVPKYTGSSTSSPVANPKVSKPTNSRSSERARDFGRDCERPGEAGVDDERKRAARREMEHPGTNLPSDHRHVLRDEPTERHGFFLRSPPWCT